MIRTCNACNEPLADQFVRALGTVFHVDCFRCLDCNSVVAGKFFPIEGPDGRQQPLCERDYCKRLDLICAKCDMPLRGSYITACEKKYHAKHFTCSVCPTLFGPQDSYYEHDGAAFCRWHYSTRFAVKCVGCNSAILKQFVEVNRNQQDDVFHPECYLVHKFWNVKVVSKPPVLATQPPPPSSPSASTHGDLAPAPTHPAYETEEQQTTAASLEAAQVKMETQVNAIWTNLSAFEESSAACISEMLTHVSAGVYLDAIRMAEKFILHVEVLFAAIDELNERFAGVGAKGISHIREARLLCCKTVDLFTLLSHTSSSNNPKCSGSGMTQELLALVTGLAYHLKTLVRIALTGALKLEQKLGENGVALDLFLNRIKALAKNGGGVRARRLASSKSPLTDPAGADDSRSENETSVTAYRYRSLAPEVAGESPFAGSAGIEIGTPSDLCLLCGLTVEEDCVRLGPYQRWHSGCVRCHKDDCGRTAMAPLRASPSNGAVAKNPTADENPKKFPSARRPPAEVGKFVFEPKADSGSGVPVPSAIYCTDHGVVPLCEPGFEAVSRLEQYAYLLNVALRRLFLLLKKRGAIVSDSANQLPRQLSLIYNRERMMDTNDLSAASVSSNQHDSNNIIRMESVHLDQSPGATARPPTRSTVLEGPTSKFMQCMDIEAQKEEIGGRGAVGQSRQTSTGTIIGLFFAYLLLIFIVNITTPMICKAVFSVYHSLSLLSSDFYEVMSSLGFSHYWPYCLYFVAFIAIFGGFVTYFWQPTPKKQGKLYSQIPYYGEPRSGGQEAKSKIQRK